MPYFYGEITNIPFSLFGRKLQISLFLLFYSSSQNIKSALLEPFVPSLIWAEVHKTCNVYVNPTEFGKKGSILYQKFEKCSAEQLRGKTTLILVKL